METWTPNQLVAYNLTKARELRGWTQERAVQEVAKYQEGAGWTAVAWSAAERSVAGKRIRQFTADDLLAFSQAFDLPLTWWLLPPGSDKDVEIAGLVQIPEPGTSIAFRQSYMVWLLMGYSADIEDRLQRTGLDEIAKSIAESQPSADQLLDVAEALYKAANMIRGAVHVREHEEKRATVKKADEPLDITEHPSHPSSTSKSSGLLWRDRNKAAPKAQPKTAPKKGRKAAGR